MTLTAISVAFQAFVSALFLLRYTMLIRWWKTVCGVMLAGMVACLFLITFTLTYTESNEGLGGTPVLVTIGRFGFGAVVTFGWTALEIRSRRRKRAKDGGQAPDKDE